MSKQYLSKILYTPSPR